MRINVAIKVHEPARPGSQQLGRACLLLGRLDEARRLGDRAQESSPRQPGFADSGKVYERTGKRELHTST